MPVVVIAGITFAIPAVTLCQLHALLTHCDYFNGHIRDALYQPAEVFYGSGTDVVVQFKAERIQQNSIQSESGIFTGVDVTCSK